MRKIILIVLALGIHHAVLSQEIDERTHQFGIKLGGNRNWKQYSYDTYGTQLKEPGTKHTYAGHFGVVYRYKFPGFLSGIQTGIEYVRKGHLDTYHQEEDDYVKFHESNSINTINYLEVPIYLRFQILNLEPFFGGYLGFALGGKYEDYYDFTLKLTDERINRTFSGNFKPYYETYTTDSEGEDKFPVRGLDVGLAVGVQKNIGAFLISGVYHFGVSNLRAEGHGRTIRTNDLYDDLYYESYQLASYMRTLKISVSYIIGRPFN